MRLKKIGENKKALSEIISYVLLILIAFSVGTLVFVWLRGRFIDKPVPQCPSEGVSIAIKNVVCNDAADTVTITIRNSGRFDIAGLVVKGRKSSGGLGNIIPADAPPQLSAGAPNPNLNMLIGNALEPNKEGVYNFSYSAATTSLGDLNQITIGVVREESSNRVVCENSYISQDVLCT